jgi:hypothetical protein
MKSPANKSAKRQDASTLIYFYRLEEFSFSMKLTWTVQNLTRNSMVQVSQAKVNGKVQYAAL